MVTAPRGEQNPAYSPSRTPPRPSPHAPRPTPRAMVDDANPAARFRRLFGAFERAGFALFLVGGSVRDHVMRRPPGTDFDFATDATPAQTRDLLRDAGFRTWDIGARFGTISTRVDGIPCEITTFRVGELYRHGSRHPEVVFGTRLADDLGRRDLSINAMAMGADGVIVDPFDGRNAIAARALEVPGGGLENSISILRDDPLRLLRIARFAARLDFAPTADTSAAARQTAPELRLISRERWKMELDKLLIAPHAATGLRWLHEVGALGVVVPALAGLDEAGLARLTALVDALPAAHIPRWAAVARCGAAASQGATPLDPPPAACATQARAIADELRVSNAERISLLRLAALEGPEFDPSRPLTPETIRRLAHYWGADRADAIALRGALAGGGPEAVAAREAEVAALAASGPIVPALPTGLGDAVMRQLGVARGPAVRTHIDEVVEAILRGELPGAPSVAECVDWLRQTSPSLRGRT